MWVCDGYQDSTYFHMNWGWGGSSDGFYSLDNLHGFNNYQLLGINFHPDSINFSYPNYASGSYTLTSIEGSITDNSGPIHDYLNNTQASWLINPQNEVDSITNIDLEVKLCSINNDGDYLRIYDGEDNTAPLLAELAGDTLPDKIVSSGNKVFIEFSSNGSGTAPGFYLNYFANLAVFCVPNDFHYDLSDTISDGSAGFPYPNNQYCSWYLLPDSDKPLTLNFNYFNTEPEYDVLSIYDFGSQELIAEISGHYPTPPEPVTAPSGKMVLLFGSNSSIQDQGWEAWYDVTTSAEDVKIENTMTIYPNPVNEKVTVILNTINSIDPIFFSLFNIAGISLRTWKFEDEKVISQKFTLDLNEFPSGIYFLQLQAGNTIETKKVVKQ